MSQGRLGLSGIVAVTALALTACGSNQDSTPQGMGGSSSTAERQALLDAIAALEEQIAAGSGDNSALQKALDDAKARLAELEVLACGDGGSCPELATAAEALVPISDAICDWIFGCCAAEETAQLGTHFGSVAACKGYYEDLLSHGQSSYLSLSVTPDPRFNRVYQFLGSGVSDAAALMASGAIQIDTAKLESCAAAIEGATCNDPSTPYLYDLAYAPLDACEGLFVGKLEAGEPCTTSAACTAGNICSNYSGYVDELVPRQHDPGICIPTAKLGSQCSSLYGCQSFEQDLYCDGDSGTCKEVAQLGESCAFKDPTHYYDIAGLLVPCARGLECSYKTETCVEPGGDGSLCYQWSPAGNYCANGYCDLTTATTTGIFPAYYYYFGLCDSGGVGGDLRNTNSQCITGQRNGSYCKGVGGEDCSAAAECGSGACSDGKCENWCSQNDSSRCASDEFCEGVRCTALREPGQACMNGSQCSTGICDADGTCVARLTAGSDCKGASSLACPTSQYCAYTKSGSTDYQCVPRIAQDASCTQASSIECASGLTCIDSTCTPIAGRAIGTACNSWIHCTSQRCAYETGLCTAGKAPGSTCNASAPYDSEALNTNPSWDECSAGYYCQQTKPNSDDFSGTCVAQKPQGAVCDSVWHDFAQCEGNVSCQYNSYLQTYLCPALDYSGSCVLSNLVYSDE